MGARVLPVPSTLVLTDAVSVQPVAEVPGFAHALVLPGVGPAATRRVRVTTRRVAVTQQVTLVRRLQDVLAVRQICRVCERRKTN